MSGPNSASVRGRRRAAELVRLSDVKPEPVTWLWEGYIPLGMLTVLDGDPGLGKSTVILDLASRLSRGDAMPDGSNGPTASGTVLLSAEDDLARVIRPRLDATGADLERVAVVRMWASVSEQREPTLSPKDLVEVERNVLELGALLVVVDPLMAYLPQDVDAHRDQDVRRVLSALRGLAERTGAAVVVVRHLNKAPGASPLYRGGGSIGIVAAARSGLLLAAEPGDSTNSVRVLASVKSNLAPPPASLRLRLTNAPGTAFARVSWEGASGHTAASLLELPPSPKDRSALDEAEGFLRELLAAGPVMAREAEDEAKAGGISARTLRRARERLGVVPRKAGQPGETGQHWQWALPEGGQPFELDASKMANPGNVGQLHEPAPAATGCTGEVVEGGHAEGCGLALDLEALAPSTHDFGQLRSEGDSNAMVGAEMSEAGQHPDAWPPSTEPAEELGRFGGVPESGKVAPHA